MVLVEIITRCGAHFTTTISVKHVGLVCFGVDPCGTAKDTVEGFGAHEHCKESENDYKKGVRRRCIDVFEYWERNKMFFFEDLLAPMSVTAPTFQWVISALNALAPRKATQESNGTKNRRWRKRTHTKKKKNE